MNTIKLWPPLNLLFDFTDKVKLFIIVGFPVNTFESNGYADMNSVIRTVVRLRVVSD